MLDNCLYVPRLNCNLISLLGLGHKEVLINQDNGAFILNSKEDTLLKGTIVNSLMKVNYSTPKELTIQISNLWHSRLGHPGNHAIKSMDLPEMSSQCLMCSKNKMHTLPFKDHFEQVSLPLGCVHLDLMGPISPTSVSQSRYFLMVVDQATSFKIVKILKTKSDVFQQFLIVKKSMENLHDQTLKRFVSYRGGEFLNHQFKKLSKEWDLNTSCHQRKLLNIMDLPKEPIKPYSKKARCLLNNSNIPNSYWAEAVNTATLLSNLIHTPSRHNLSPHQLFKGLPPCIKKLQVFGC
ncbi:hypothetical protein O181_036202 [Austropuccinia psidii MF-1]|uniref:Integrase catalytic domain-containing protein n=1 Tax=Austropuccinia psidii MF-1 TaxID=1389203 RepID=A0A9Q3DA79_9BASI|nr:hypothetical protein [Austropuccinia psidii MF-1]